MAWLCPICGNPGKRSQEHVFADWLGDLFGVAAQSVTLNSSKAGRLWSSRGFSVVVNVCATCNNGWMSNLEGRFGAAFSDAILGQPKTFGRDEMTVLAHWASKTAIMLQPHLGGMRERSHVPNGHLASLPSGVPDGTRVWLGAYAPPTRFVFWQNVPMSPGEVPLTPDSAPSGYIMLMTVGFMMFVVLGLDAEYGDDFSVVGLPDGVFQPVWPLPADPVRWPNGLILNNNGIQTFWPPKSGALIAFGPRPVTG